MECIGQIPDSSAAISDPSRIIFIGDGSDPCRHLPDMILITLGKFMTSVKQSFQHGKDDGHPGGGAFSTSRAVWFLIQMACC